MSGPRKRDSKRPHRGALHLHVFGVPHHEEYGPTTAMGEGHFVVEGNTSPACLELARDVVTWWLKCNSPTTEMAMDGPINVPFAWSSHDSLAVEQLHLHLDKPPNEQTDAVLMFNACSSRIHLQQQVQETAQVIRRVCPWAPLILSSNVGGSGGGLALGELFRLVKKQSSIDSFGWFTSTSNDDGDASKQYHGLDQAFIDAVVCRVTTMNRKAMRASFEHMASSQRGTFAGLNLTVGRWRCFVARSSSRKELLQHATHLDFSNNYFQSIPESICSLGNLTHLCLSGNRIGAIPPQCALWGTLQTLDIRDNSITPSDETYIRLSEEHRVRVLCGSTAPSDADVLRGLTSSAPQVRVLQMKGPPPPTTHNIPPPRGVLPPPPAMASASTQQHPPSLPPPLPPMAREGDEGEGPRVKIPHRVFRANTLPSLPPRSMTLPAPIAHDIHHDDDDDDDDDVSRAAASHTSSAPPLSFLPPPPPVGEVPRLNGAVGPPMLPRSATLPILPVNLPPPMSEKIISKKNVLGGNLPPPPPDGMLHPSSSGILPPPPNATSSTRTPDPRILPPPPSSPVSFGVAMPPSLPQISVGDTPQNDQPKETPSVELPPMPARDRGSEIVMNDTKDDAKGPSSSSTVVLDDEASKAISTPVKPLNLPPSLPKRDRGSMRVNALVSPSVRDGSNGSLVGENGAKSGSNWVMSARKDPRRADATPLVHNRRTRERGWTLCSRPSMEGIQTARARSSSRCDIVLGARGERNPGKGGSSTHFSSSTHLSSSNPPAADVLPQNAGGHSLTLPPLPMRDRTSDLATKVDQFRTNLMAQDPKVFGPPLTRTTDTSNDAGEDAPSTINRRRALSRAGSTLMKNKDMSIAVANFKAKERAEASQMRPVARVPSVHGGVDVKEWSIDSVQQMLVKNGFHQHCTSFAKNHIDGEVLLSLTRHEMRHYLLVDQEAHLDRLIALIQGLKRGEVGRSSTREDEVMVHHREPPPISTLNEDHTSDTRMPPPPPPFDDDGDEVNQTGVVLPPPPPPFDDDEDDEDDGDEGDQTRVALPPPPPPFDDGDEVEHTRVALPPPFDDKDDDGDEVDQTRVALPPPPPPSFEEPKVITKVHKIAKFAYPIPPSLQGDVQSREEVPSKPLNNDAGMHKPLPTPMPAEGRGGGGVHNKPLPTPIPAGGGRGGARNKPLPTPMATRGGARNKPLPTPMSTRGGARNKPLPTPLGTSGT